MAKKKAKPQRVSASSLNIDTKYSFYANGLVGKYKEDEIILEFLQGPPHSDSRLWGNRIYMSPSFAKHVLRELSDLIDKYNRKMGEVDEKGDEVAYG